MPLRFRVSRRTVEFAQRVVAHRARKDRLGELVLEVQFEVVEQTSGVGEIADVDGAGASFRSV